MAGLDATQVRVGVTGKLLVAPVGTTAPANTSGGWPAGWVDLGYGEDGGPPAEVRPNQTTKDFKGWQDYYPVRTVSTDRAMEWIFKLIQKSGTNLKLAFGGGTITSLGGGDYKFVPPAASFVDERAFGLEVTDGSIIDRFVLTRGLVSALAPVQFRKDDIVKFDLTIKALAPPSGSDPWTLISNDPAMAS